MEEVENGEGHSSEESTLLTQDAPAICEKTDIIFEEAVLIEEDAKVTVPLKVAHSPVATGSNQTKTSEVSESLKRKGVIDTAQPIDSVKDAVGKFGGIVDWKAHKVMAIEKSTHILGELEKVQEDIPKYMKQSEAAKVSKDEVLEELDMTKKLIEELRHSLEKTETEEAQAKQDSELAQLRVKEMEQGISDDASTAAKAQMEVAKSRHTAAVDELKPVKEDLEALQGDYHRLVTERNSAMARSEEAVSASKDAEKKAEDLTLELMTIKEALESAHASHLEAEERRISLAMAKDQDVHKWEKDLAKAKEELKQLSDQESSVEDLKAKLEITSTMLLNLKTEQAFYMEGKLLKDTGIIKEESETSIAKTSVQSELASSARKELEEVKTIIEKTKDEVNCLGEAASSLKAELDRETETFTTLKQREGITSVSVSSLEAELSRMLSELELVLTRERVAREKMEELPKLLQQATYDADQAKSVSQLAGEELGKAKEEAEEVMAGVSTTESRLLAVLKEIEAAKGSEALAVAAIKAMVDCEKKQGEVVVSTEMESEAPTDTEVVTVQLEEYYTLSENAHDAEELANERVTSAVEQIKKAKNSELANFEKLEEANKELEEKKKALKAAVEMADKANKGELNAELELRDWRADNEQQRRASDAGASHLELNASESTLESLERGEASRPLSGEASLRLNSMSCPDFYIEHHVPDLKPRKKKSFFPWIVMFLARKKAQPLK